MISGKFILNERPDSTEKLKVQLKEKLSLQYDFKLQYEVQDFNLTKISEQNIRSPS